MSVTTIASWVGSGIAVITAGLCWLLLRHLNHLPSGTHPWLHRAAIIGMYCAGLVFTFTAAGHWIEVKCQQALGLVGASTAPGSGLGWALVTLGAIALAAAVFVALVWVPNPHYAYVALATPLVLALAPAGFAHQIYAVTAAPAMTLVTSVATWAGG
jgi:hypothetical protein